MKATTLAIHGTGNNWEHTRGDDKGSKQQAAVMGTVYRNYHHAYHALLLIASGWLVGWPAASSNGRPLVVCLTWREARGRSVFFPLRHGFSVQCRTFEPSICQRPSTCQHCPHRDDMMDAWPPIQSRMICSRLTWRSLCSSFCATQDLYSKP